MKFEGALAAMREGEKIRLSTWVDKGEYIYLTYEGRDELDIYFQSGNLCEMSSSFTLDDNWEIYTEPAKPLTFYEALKIVEGGGKVEATHVSTVKATIELEDGSLKYIYGDYLCRISKADFDATWYEV